MFCAACKLQNPHVIPQTSKAKTTRQFQPLTRRIVDLKRERAKLEEEVLQLRAAVRIWAEVCQQTRAAAKIAQKLTDRVQ